MQGCFIGHRTIKKTEALVSLLKETVEALIDKGVTAFLFGSMSEFDELSWEVVTKLKEKYPFIKRIYVRSGYPRIDKAYEEYLFELYEETYFPTSLENAGKYVYVERNYEMIDNSTYCVFYYNENYTPPLKQRFKYNSSMPLRRTSGTKIAYEYAVKKKKTIINLYK